MPEWLMGVDCKSAGYTYVGSNPTRPNQIRKMFKKHAYPPVTGPSKDGYASVFKHK